MNGNGKEPTPKERRMKRERKLRRQGIAEVAERHFIEHGYDYAKVEDIAAEAGYTKATIYNYFESKDGLFLAVEARVFDILYEVMEKSLKEPTISNELRAMGEGYLRFVLEYPYLAEFIETGRISVLIANIVRKEQEGVALSESETEYREAQLRVEKLMSEAVNKTLGTLGVEGKVDTFSVVMGLSTIGLSIRELIRRGKAGNWSEEESRKYLDVLFTIIEQGLKHYDD
jgi:AcrR family transcriptional regulator